MKNYILLLLNIFLFIIVSVPAIIFGMGVLFIAFLFQLIGRKDFLTVKIM